jgi:hypothetical protein
MGVYDMAFSPDEIPGWRTMSFFQLLTTRIQFRWLRLRIVRLRARNLPMTNHPGPNLNRLTPQSFYFSTRHFACKSVIGLSLIDEAFVIRNARCPTCQQQHLWSV